MPEAKTRGKFARQAEALLRRDGKGPRPTSLADLIDEPPDGETEDRHSDIAASRQAGMPEERGAGITVSRQDGKPVTTEKKRVRVEARVPANLAETLREYAHQHRQSHAVVVAEALRAFFERERFEIVESE